jgi:hypothetical protein
VHFLLPPTGGPFFNLFNLGKTEAEMKTLKLKEIKNGRLAMLAMFGYGAQVGVGGRGNGRGGMRLGVSPCAGCCWSGCAHSGALCGCGLLCYRRCCHQLCLTGWA